MSEMRGYITTRFSWVMRSFSSGLKFRMRFLVCFCCCLFVCLLIFFFLTFYRSSELAFVRCYSPRFILLAGGGDDAATVGGAFFGYFLLLSSSLVCVFVQKHSISLLRIYGVRKFILCGLTTQKGNWDEDKWLYCQWVWVRARDAGLQN